MKKLVLFVLFTCFNFVVLAGTADEFITIWKTDNAGQSAPNEIRFYGEGNGYTLIWEEVGNPSNNDSLTAGVINSGDFQLVSFPVAGTYRIRVDPTAGGSFTNFRADGDKEKLIEIAQWGSTAWTNLRQAFRNCHNLDVTAPDAPNLTNVSSLYQTFANCSGLIGTPAFNTWQTGTITSMYAMFENASAFNQPIGNWNVSAVTTMDYMFKNAASFNQPLSTWNVSAVSNMLAMFENATSFNQDLSNWTFSSIEQGTPGGYAFLNNSGMDCINYSLLLNSLAEHLNLPSNVNFGVRGLTYDSTASAAHAYLVNIKGWILSNDNYVADCSTALPLSLYDFTAKYQEPYAVLNWQVGDETDVDFYEVEQAVDGAHFEVVQRIAKQADAPVYTYNHLQQEALAYYRIKAVSYSGQQSYSETRSLRATATDNHPLVRLYPNPVEGSTLQLQVSQSMEVEFFDQLGKSLGKHLLEPGDNSFDVSAFPAGLYWLRHSEGSLKFIVTQ